MRSYRPEFPCRIGNIHQTKVHKVNKLRQCAVIRPLRDKFGGAVATIASFTADGLFAGPTPEFFQVVNQLAQAADAAHRES